MHEAAVQQDRLRLRIADAAAELPGQAFLDLEVDVHEVRRAGHRGRLDVDLLDEGQPLQALLRPLDGGVRQVSALHLAHLAAQHLVVDAGRAAEVDVAHVGAAARLHQERERDLLGLRVLLRHGVDLREGVTVLAEAQRHQLGGRRDHAARIDVAAAHLHEAHEVLLRHDEVAGDLDLRHAVDGALVHVERDVDVLLVGRYRHLGGHHVEVRVAAVEVERAQLLDVARELLARVAVVLPVPGQPVRRLQLELLAQFVLGEGLVADDVDLLDLRALAFLDVDGDADLVVRQVGDLGVHAHAVLAARVVLVGQETVDFVERGLVEHLALGQTRRCGATFPCPPS